MKEIFVKLIKFYQYLISPLLGTNCRFNPTCSRYAEECFQKFPIPLALWYTSLRIFKCHPFHAGGDDPVP